MAVLVVTDDASVARWAARPITLGPGFHMRPLVVDLDAVPTVLDDREALRAPELAVLGAVKLAKANDSPVAAARAVQTALVACLSLDAEKSLLYSEWILSLLAP